MKIKYVYIMEAKFSNVDGWEPYARMGAGDSQEQCKSEFEKRSYVLGDAWRHPDGLIDMKNWRIALYKRCESKTATKGKRNKRKVTK